MMFFYKKFGRNNESVYICNHIFNECSHFGRAIWSFGGCGRRVTNIVKLKNKTPIVKNIT